MFDGAPSPLEVTYLAPGQIAVTSEPRVIRTILGSCVSVSLHDPELRAGGLTHYLLPGGDDREKHTYRYGEIALQALLDEMKALGSSVFRVQAGVFGGARVFNEAFQAMHLGERNVEFAFSWLKERRIPVVARDVLGTQARRLEFRVPDGGTHIRLLGGP